MATSRKATSGSRVVAQATPRAPLFALSRGATLEDAVAEGSAKLLEVALWSEAPPLVRLEAATHVLTALDDAMAGAMADARALGISWRRIGEACDLSGPGARLRFDNLGAPDPDPYWADVAEDVASIRALSVQTKNASG